MLKLHLLLTLRNFQRNKVSFLINLIGLSTGLACALLIYLWVHDEMAVDKLHDSQLYQLVQNYKRSEGIKTRAITPAYFAKLAKESIPEVLEAVPVNNEYSFTEEGILSVDQQDFKARPIFAGADYFKVFSFPLLHGDKEQVLADKNAIVISEGLSRKMFGSTEGVVGKTIRWEHDVFKGDFLISGIFKDLPANSTEQFDLMFNFEQALDPYEESRDWSTDAARTFLIVKAGTDIDQLNKKLTQVLHSKPYRDNCSIFAQAFSSRYLHGLYENGEIAGGRIFYVKIFSIIAIFLLIIACVNFMNLSTARASTRMKEVGVRKTTGASREMLAFQFLGESVLMAVFSFAVALIWMAVFLPHFNEITEKQLSFDIGGQALLSVAGIVLLTGIIAGSYPAFYLSGFEPATVLKGKFKISFGEEWIRKGLVIFQFGLSVLFIIGFLIVNRQLDFIQQKQLGYNKDNIVNFVSKGQSSEDVETFMQQLRNLPGVIQATNIHGGGFIGNKNFGSAPTWEGVPLTHRIRVPRPHVGYGYIETLGIELVEGRTFSRDYADEESKVVINEAAAELIGYEQPIGGILRRGPDELQIIGVVKDFHNESLHHEVSPTFIRFLPKGINIMTKIRAGEEVATIQRLKQTYEKFHPGFPFEFSFMDDEYQKMYDAENRVASLSNYFAAIAIIISCLGLFGLAMFTAERRKKEIGIRKVLGSGVFGIVQMLTRDFIKTVSIAILISIPLGYWAAKTWLANFAYSIDLQWWLFLLPALLVLCIAWCTVGMHTLKAALMNPAHSLKDE